MPTKPKLLFVYDHPKLEWWADGLSAALDVLEEDFDITRDNLVGNKAQYFGDFNFVLGWGAFSSRVDTVMQQTRQLGPQVKLGLCIAGNSFPPDGATNYDILFAETDWIKDVYLRGVTTPIVKAFGVNTDLFSPIDFATPIVWDYLGVGALATWKRWEKMAGKGGRKLVVGEFQEGNVTESALISASLLRFGVAVSGQVAPLDLVNLYHWSRTLYVPADLNGGGERAVLEARSCGLNVEVEPDNPKLQELVDLPQIPSHHDYAAALKAGILSAL